MGNNYITYHEIVDYQGAGETKWFLEDKNGNRTPIFNNRPSVIYTSDSTCMFLGESNGYVKLYLVDAEKSLESNKLYECYDLEGNAKMINPYKDNIIIVNTNMGQYFYNIETKKRTSDIFDIISFDRRDDGKDPFFEKTISKGDITTTLYGTVLSNGLLGRVIYDTEKDAYITTPKKTNEDGIELLDYNALFNYLASETFDKYRKLDQKIKMLRRMNCNNMPYFNRNNNE